MVYARYCDAWAEPLPPEPPEPEPAFTVEITHEAEAQEEPEEEETEEDFMDNDLMILCQCVEAEAANQSSLGKRLVADVVLNRCDKPEFPDTVKEVIFQPGQFAVVDSGAIYTVTPTLETIDAVIEEKERRIDKDIVYFQKGQYSRYGEAYTRVDDHYFSK